MNPNNSAPQSTILESSVISSSQDNPKVPGRQVPRGVDKQPPSNSPPATSAETKESQSQSTVDNKNPNNPEHQPSFDSSVPSSQAGSKVSGCQVTGAVDKQLPSNFPPASGTKASQSQSIVDNKDTSNPPTHHHSTTHKSSAVLPRAVDEQLSSNSPPASNAGTKASQSQSAVGRTNPNNPTPPSAAPSSSIDSKVSGRQPTGAVDKDVAPNSPPASDNRLAGTQESQWQSTIDNKNPNTHTHRPTRPESSATPSSPVDSKASGHQVTAVVDKQLASNSLPASNNRFAGTKENQSQSTVNRKNSSDPTSQFTPDITSATPSSLVDSKVSGRQATGAADKQLASNYPPASDNRIASTKQSQSQSTIDLKDSNSSTPLSQSTRLESSTIPSSRQDSKASGRQVTGAVDKQPSDSPLASNNRFTGTKVNQSQSPVDVKNPNASMPQSTALESSAITSSQVNPNVSGRQVAGGVDKQLPFNSPPASDNRLAETKATQSQSPVNAKNPNNPTHQSAPPESSQFVSKVSGCQVVETVNSQLPSNAVNNQLAGTKESQLQSSVDKKDPNKLTHRSTPDPSTNPSSLAASTVAVHKVPHAVDTQPPSNSPSKSKDQLGGIKQSQSHGTVNVSNLTDLTPQCTRLN